MINNVSDLKKVFSYIGNKTEAINDRCNCRLPIVSFLLIHYREMDVKVVEVIDYRDNYWANPKYTVDNIKTLEKSYNSPTSTYGSCIDAMVEYDPKDDIFYATLIVWDGDNIDGFRTEKRVRIEYEIREVLHPTIIQEALHDYNRHLESEYTAYLAEQKKQWISDRMARELSL